ncbi:GNAT family N-acetyltransferase [Arthrobacter sp. 4R501]|uniref:GNAT family N-acetyltransferase n=1 Tax=Arthrobacter sp. 4R501 TaxID=2058886 RepID=UPI000CE5489D|nr:GNAT family N-acetyltransferase [Arthrobacter sp. 4R501]
MKSTTGRSALTTLEFRELHALEEMLQVTALLATVWRDEGSRHFEPALLVALAHAENYVVGVYDGEEIVAACVGFFAAPQGATLHSHIAGVKAEYAGQGIGGALKEHQRSWCRARNIETITWTFDPLVARNAYFNIARLGAFASEYLVDFYGKMTDEVNAGQPSDRMLVAWPVTRDPSEPVSAEGTPVLLKVGDREEPIVRTSQEDRVALQIPTDIESMRHSDPTMARAWRLVLRSELGTRMLSGWTVTGFDKAGYYILERTTNENLVR